MGLLVVRYQGRNGTRQRRIHDNPKNVWKPIGLWPTKQELKLLTLLSNLHDVAKGFDEELVTNNDFVSYHRGGGGRGKNNPPPPQICCSYIQN